MFFLIQINSVFFNLVYVRIWKEQSSHTTYSFSHNLQKEQLSTPDKLLFFSPVAPAVACWFFPGAERGARPSAPMASSGWVFSVAGAQFDPAICVPTHRDATPATVENWHCYVKFFVILQFHNPTIHCWKLTSLQNGLCNPAIPQSYHPLLKTDITTECSL